MTGWSIQVKILMCFFLEKIKDAVVFHMFISQAYVIERSDTFQINTSTLGLRAFAFFVLKLTKTAKAL